MSEQTPELWSGFNGTAVGIAKMTDPRNWWKYTLPEVEGYTDFLKGVAAAGVEIAGVVYRRPDSLIRRKATARSIAKLGFGEFFTDSTQIVQKGSEEAIGRFVAKQSRSTTIGMIDGKPHSIGPALIRALTEPVQHSESSQYPILLGVVSHPRSQEYIERLAEQLQATEDGNLMISETGPDDEMGLIIRASQLDANQLDLIVVPLTPYSQQAGETFGLSLQDLAATSAQIPHPIRAEQADRLPALDSSPSR